LLDLWLGEVQHVEAIDAGVNIVTLPKFGLSARRIEILSVGYRRRATHFSQKIYDRLYGSKVLELACRQRLPRALALNAVTQTVKTGFHKDGVLVQHRLG